MKVQFTGRLGGSMFLPGQVGTFVMEMLRFLLHCMREICDMDKDLKTKFLYSIVVGTRARDGMAMPKDTLLKYDFCLLFFVFLS